MNASANHLIVEYNTIVEYHLIVEYNTIVEYHLIVQPYYEWSYMQKQL